MAAGSPRLATGKDLSLAARQADLEATRLMQEASKKWALAERLRIAAGLAYQRENRKKAASEQEKK